MICKNCGAQMKDKARVCPVCGAFVDDESGYTLLTADDKLDDYYSYDPYARPPKRRGRTALLLLLAVVVIALSSVGGLYFMNNIAPKLSPNPAVSMQTGSGIINENEKVIYVTLSNKDIVRIHGVSLIDSKLDSNAVITSDYEYTKNVNDTFRAIFFDTKELELKSGKTYEYEFEIKLSFNGDERIYTYRQPIKFDGNISGDAADIVFDHSMSDGTAANSGDAAQTTQKKKAKIGFIREGFWYTVPESRDGVNTVAALEFLSSGKVNRYTYTQEDEGEWKRADASGKYTLDSDILTLTIGNDTLQVKVDGKKLIQLKDGKPAGELASRVYNSAINAQTFFDEDEED